MSFVLIGPNQQQNTTDDEDTYLVPNLIPDRPTESNITCPLEYAYRIYQTINTNKDQIAFEQIAFPYVDVYVWSPKFKSVKYKPYSSKRFARKCVNKHFKYAGDATAGRPTVPLWYYKLRSIVFYLFVDSVQAVRDWFRIKKKKISLYYCKRNCSTQVLHLLKPCNKN